METPLNILTHWQLLSVLFATLFAAGGLTLWKQGFFSKEPRRFFLGTLRPTQVKMLKEAQIPFEEGLFLGQAGVLVKAQNRDRALQALHATLTATGERGRKEEKTADAQRLTLAFADGQPLHTINFVGRFPVHPIRIAAAVSEWLVPLVERDVVVWGLDAEGPQGPDDGKFHLIPGTYLEPQGDSQAGNVYLKSWPRINWHYQEQGVMDIWSATLPTMLASRLPKPQAVQLPAEYSGFYPLEMQDNKLYFLFDVLAQDNEHIGWFARRQRRSARQGRDIYLDLFALGLKKFSSEINAERRIQDCIKEAGVTEPAVRAILRSKDDAPAGTTHIEVKVQNLLGSQEQIRRPAVLAELARQILGPLCSRSITIVNGSDKVLPPPSGAMGEDLTIYFHSAPADNRRVQSPRRFWGYQSADKDLIFGPSAKGIPIMCDNGYTVGELVGRTLYVFPQLVRDANHEETMLWARFLLEARQIMLRLKTEKKQTLLAESFARQCLQKSKGLARQSVAADLKYAAAKMTDGLRTTIEAQKTMFQMEILPYNDLGDEFDSLLAIPKVTDVTVGKNQVVVKTSTLYCRDPRTKILHEIGPFEIIIHSESADGLRWLNKGPGAKPHGMNAPHVNGEGKACLGNMAEVFKQLIAKRQYAAAIEAAIAFVEAVNVDDAWGKRIHEWPKAGQNAGEVK